MTNLETWNVWTRDIESADVFLRWGWYGSVLSTLKRDVWFTGVDPTDNLNCIWPCEFILFVGPPAAGKGRAMNASNYLLNCVKEGGKKLIHAGPSSGSMQGLLKRLSEATYERNVVGLPETYRYHCMTISSEELGVLLKKEDKDTGPVLQQAYDARSFDKTTVTADCFDMEHIAVNLISCTQPDWIKNNFNTSLFAQGLMSRFVIVFADGPRFFRDSVEPCQEAIGAKTALVEYLTKLSKLFGRVKFTPEAVEYRRQIIMPVNIQENYFHKRANNSQWLESYYNRKRLHWFKLSMAMHFSESLEMTMDRPVMEAAYNFINETELNMHRAFEKIASNPNYDSQQKMFALVKTHGTSGISRGELRIAANQHMDAKAYNEMLELWATTGSVKIEGSRFYVK